MKRNKYKVAPAGARTFRGVLFDSKKEMLRFIALLSEEESGSISDLKCQMPFVLQDKFTDSEGRKIREITYIADFVYIRDGKTIVEDVKGVKTRDYILKKKMFKFKYRDLIFKES